MQWFNTQIPEKLSFLCSYIAVVQCAILMRPEDSLATPLVVWLMAGRSEKQLLRKKEKNTLLVGMAGEKNDSVNKGCGDEKPKPG